MITKEAQSYIMRNGLVNIAYVLVEMFLESKSADYFWEEVSLATDPDFCGLVMHRANRLSAENTSSVAKRIKIEYSLFARDGWFVKFDVQEHGLLLPGETISYGIHRNCVGFD